MRMSLEQVVNDTLTYGYDFHELLNNLEKKIEQREYIYGYALAEDKVGYLESMAENRVIYCDRIYLFQEEINDYLHEIESMPHSRIFSGFVAANDFKHEDGSIFKASVFRIILINAHNKTSFARDLEYMDNGFREILSVWGSNLNYEDVSKIIYNSEPEMVVKEVEKLDCFFDHICDIKL